MCDFATALLVTQSVGAVAGTIGARNSAEAQMELTNQQLEKQQEQMAVQSATEQTEASIRRQEERATARVAAGEAGVGGTSLMDSLVDSYIQEGRELGSINYNTRIRTEAARTQARSRNTRTSNAAPTGLDAGLAIAGAAADYDARTDGRLTDYFIDEDK